MNEMDAARLADMAVELHDQPDVAQTLGRTVEYAMQAVRCDAAGLVFLRGRGRVEAAAASSDVAAEADRLQTELGEGPCLDAIFQQASPLVEDTVTDDRWRAWNPKAAALGLRSVLSVRLHTAHGTLGALNLYGRAPGQFHKDDPDTADIFGRHAAVALAAAWHEDGLREAISSRHLVGQAQGILMERYGLDTNQAFALLRRYSQHNNIKLRFVADAVISTGRMPDHD